jgi:hypothetical protein
MLVAEHVAIRFWSQTLKANGSYRTLKEEIPASNKAIDNMLNAKKVHGERVSFRSSGTKERWWCRQISDGTEETIDKASQANGAYRTLTKTIRQRGSDQE